MFELFLARSDELRVSFRDPCQEWANASDPNIATNCASLGIPDDWRPTVFDTEVSSGGAVAPDGSANIRPETSDSWSVGLIFTPQDLGLAIAVEYFDIEVNDQIDSLGAQQIVNQCYGNESFPNPFCGLIERNGDTISNPYLLTLVDDRFLNIDSQGKQGD